MSQCTVEGEGRVSVLLSLVFLHVDCWIFKQVSF